MVPTGPSPELAKAQELGITIWDGKNFYPSSKSHELGDASRNSRNYKKI